MTLSGIIGVCLAAGKSSRMGRDKRLLPIGETTIGSHVLQTTIESYLDHTMVITKKEDTLNWIESRLFNDANQDRWSPIVCEKAEEGQAYSLKCGVETAKKSGAKGILILLADQPFVQTKMINNLIKQFQDGLYKGQPIDFVGSGFKGRCQPPILFSKTLFPELMQLQGDTGARAIIRGNRSHSGTSIDYQDWRLFYDVDTEEDYQWVEIINRCLNQNA